MSDSGCQSSLQSVSRLGRSDMEKDLDCGSEISVQRVSKNPDSTASPGLIDEKLPSMLHEGHLSSSDSYTASGHLSISDTSFFADPTVRRKSSELNSVEISLNSSDKYFSTPMPSRERVRKKLTPVMEVDFESNMSEESKNLEKVSTTDMLDGDSYCADVLPHESPTQTPLYRSFFAAECQEIAKQIEGKKTDARQSPGKRKSEELDVSTIDAEPPPYDCTPMKSMLASEVAKMFCSMESSPDKEGLSQFGESLLDLEKTDMQIPEFNLPEFGIDNTRRYSACSPLQRSLISGNLYSIQAKRQKTEPLEKIDWGVSVNQGNKMSPLPHVGCLTPETPIEKSLYVCTTGKAITASLTNNDVHTELSNVIVGLTSLIQDTAEAPLAPVSTATSVRPVLEGTPVTRLKNLFQAAEQKLCTNTTQDIVLNYEELPPADTTHEIELSHTRRNSTSIHEVPHAFNTTQDVPVGQEKVNVVNTKRLTEIVGMGSGGTRQDIAPVHADSVFGNTTRDIAQVHDDAVSSNTTQDIALLSSNNTQVIDVAPLSGNTTQDIAPLSSNNTQVIDVATQSGNTTQDIAPQSGNTTQDIAPVHGNAISGNTTQDIAPPSGNTTQDIAPPSGNTTQDIAPQSGNTTHDITPLHEVGVAANTTQMIEVDLQIPVNTTQNVLSMHESKAANTPCKLDAELHNAMQNIASIPGTPLTVGTPINESVPQASTDSAPGTMATPDGITTSCSQDISVKQKSSMDVRPEDEATHTLHTDAVPGPVCNADPSHDEIMPAIHNHLLKDVTQTSLNVSAPHSMNLAAATTTEPNAEISVSNSGSAINAENKENLMFDNQKSVSKLDPEQETLVVNDLKDSPPVEPKAQTSHPDLSCITPDSSTLVSLPAQAQCNVTEGHEKSSDCRTGVGSSQKIVDTCKESRDRPLLSESCSLIQEEESAHDVSVFSVGSLSFITSTPVPGLNNFQFQNNCRESVQQDPNVSLILDDSSTKVLGDQRMIPQQKAHDAHRVDYKDQGKQETSCGSFLPPSMQRSMAPPSEAATKQMPSTSGIPSARRSLALYQHKSQNPARGLAFSKIAPRSGIPGRGMIHPPLARQSLPRATLGNPKQAMEGTGGSGITNKLSQSRLITPKAGAVAVKAKSVTHSQLPAAPSIKPPSRMAPPTTGRLSIGVHNAAANLHEAPRADTVSAVRPPISGLRAGPPRPGASSGRPPLQQLQKASLKLKSQVQGPVTKKTQRELPTLRSQKESSQRAESRSSTKQATFPLDSTEQAAAFQEVMTESNHEKSRHPEMSSCCQLGKAYEDFKRHYELAKSENETCRDVEICNCAQLLKMYEDFRRLFGQVDLSYTADT
ncbi:serine-rich adhesin for platelets-like isoform X2 [Dendropsophus ebraccatus]|uniref:serine-rich adhesin for platelets-like isoform X2 n=1 Tax=Dendropsophus ebraccatus TaxID=150705 RepID=UPI003831C0AD